MLDDSYGAHNKAVDDNRFRPGAQFAAILYDDKVNIVALPGECVGYLFILIFISVYAPLCANMTSFTKPEVHNIGPYCIVSREKPSHDRRKQQKISWSLDMWFLRYASGQTERQTDISNMRPISSNFCLISAFFGGEGALNLQDQKMTDQTRSKAEKSRT